MDPKVEPAPLTTVDKIVKWVGVILMLEWAIIHMFAGIISMSFAYPNDIASYVIGINAHAPAAEKERTLAVDDWSFLVQRVLIQHAWNLLFVGTWALVLTFVVAARPIPRSTVLLSLFPWFFDMGFLIAIEIPKYANELSSAQTFLLAVAIACFNYILKQRFGELPAWEYFGAYGLAAMLFLFGVCLAIVHAAGATPSPLEA